MGRNQYWAGRVYDLCVYYMTGTPEGSTESGFMEKPGIEPATPGLLLPPHHGGFSSVQPILITWMVGVSLPGRGIKKGSIYVVLQK